VKLEALVVSHPLRYVRLKFGKGVYCVIELRRGDDAVEVAKKLRELAHQVERLKHEKLDRDRAKSPAPLGRVSVRG